MSNASTFRFPLLIMIMDNGNLCTRQMWAIEKEKSVVPISPNPFDGVRSRQIRTL